MQSLQTVISRSRMKNKGYSIATLITALAALTVGFVGYLYFSSPPAKFPDEVADWKVYQDAEYGFEVRYPAHLSAQVPSEMHGHEFENGIRVTKQDSSLAGDYLIQFAGIEKNTERYFTELKSFERFPNAKTITFAEKQAFRFDMESTNEIGFTILLPKDDGHTIVIDAIYDSVDFEGEDMHTLSQDEKGRVLKEIESVISTFKFIQ